MDFERKISEVHNLTPDFMIDDDFQPDQIDFEQDMMDYDSMFPVVSISTTQRLLKYPEMYNLRPIRKPKPLIGFPEPHPVVVDENQRIETTTVPVKEKMRIAQCNVCEHWFKSELVMSTHRMRHDLEAVISSRALLKEPRFICPFDDCQSHCDCQLTINEHVETFHGRTDLMYESLQFPNFTEFERWKENIELQTPCRFVQTSARNTGAGRTVRFSCFFTRTHPPQSTSAKGLRLRHSRKLDKSCTAFLSVRDIQGQYQVRGCLTHCGHDHSVYNLPLTNSIRREVIDSLAKGMSEEQIFQTFTEMYPSTDRRFFIRPYEIRNIHNKLRKMQEIHITPHPEAMKIDTVDDDEVPKVDREEEC